MILYLAGNTQPFIVYAVHQCARFSHNPIRSHDIGLKHIARYLNYTEDKSLIIQLDHKNLKLDLFADADLVGLYASEDNQDPSSVKSRTGILLNFGDIPIYWSSKL